MMKELKLLFFLFILFIPVSIKAYGMENYYIDAVVEKDGDILVQEYFNLTGEFNGFERIIEYSNDSAYEFDPTMTSFGGSKIHNGTGLEIIEVRAVSIDSNFNFSDIGGKIFSETSTASKGDYGVYDESILSNGKSLLIYNPSSYNKAFYIKYRINNIAIKHNDVGEIGWNIIGNELRESVSNFKAYLHIPGNTNIRAWAHGPINGNVDIIDNETVLFTISNLSSYRAIDIRATFDLSVISNSNKVTNVDALNKIILYEEDMAEQANYERRNQEKLRQQKALECINQFEVNITRYNYEYALEDASEITDENVKNEYLTRLAELKLLLDEKEESDAQDALSFVEAYPEYIWYMDAKEKIEVLDNQELKAKLLNQLSVVEEEIKEAELEQEKLNYIFGFILTIIIIGLGIWIYIKYRKDPSVDFNQKYLREIPNDYSPETVSYLFHKKITDNALSAGMLDLVRKKIIFVEKIKFNNYKLTVNYDYKEALTSTEERLMKLIFHGRHNIETKDIKTYAKKNYSSFISYWKSYHNTALTNAKRNLFYESDGKLKETKKLKESNSLLGCLITGIIIIGCVFPMLLFFIGVGYLLYKIVNFIIKFFKDEFKDTNGKVNEKYQKLSFAVGLIIYSIICFWWFVQILISQHYYKFSSIVYIICSIVSICLITLIFTKKKRTVDGALEYKEWKALKNFLNDFGKFADKEVMEVVLWEKYLVYATLFGCAKKVVKVMKIKMVDMPNDYFDNYLDLYVMNRYITSSLRSSYSTAQSAYVAANSSSSSGGFSSGGGGGGGFSSGGGSFGGGGGGGRF